MVGNVVSLIGTIFGERLMYLPSLFFLVLVALAVAKWPANIWSIVLVALVVLGSARSFTYARRWNDRLSFLQHATDEQPGAIALYRLTAEELDRRGQIEQAARLLAKGRAAVP